MQRLEKHSPLVTAAPFHIPGYSGFVPHNRDFCGRTFGQQTHHSLTLANRTRSKSSFGNQFKEETRPYPKSNSFTQGKYKSPIIPGYSGFVPITQNAIGGTYSRLTSKAVDEFSHSYDKYKKREFGKTNSKCSKLRTQFNPPSQGNAEPRLSYFRPGYGGFVPHSRYIIGKNFVETTADALMTFRRDEAQQRQTLKTPLKF